MKILTKEEEDEHYAAVLRGGITGGLCGLGLGIGANILLTKRWGFYRTLTIPLRTFFVTSTGTFAAIVAADRYSRHYEAQKHDYDYKDSTARLLAESQANQTGWEKAMAVGKEYRYSIVTASWLASMAGSLAMVSRDKYLTGAQKLVQARMYAQGLTLLILVATAAFEVADKKAEQEERAMIDDPKHPGQKTAVKIHHETYRGEDQWKG